LLHDTEIGKNVPNEHKIYQMVKNISIVRLKYITFSNLRPSKIGPNLDFWSENKPSGNPALYNHQTTLKYITFSNLRPSKIDPNLDFWFENKPSGNPALYNHEITAETFDT
jgi:hypothetical protein